MSEDAAPVGAPPKNLADGIVKALRPRQWVKNVLVLAAPLAAGSVTDRDVLLSVALAFIVFCFAASGVYLVNDAMDVEADRAHPTKRFCRSSRTGSSRWSSASTSSSSWRTASASSTRPCSTSASSPRASCSARSPVASLPRSRSHSGSC
jgi:hypothetical protein